MMQLPMHLHFRYIQPINHHPYGKGAQYTQYYGDLYGSQITSILPQ